MELILMLFFSYRLHKQAVSLNLSSWKWVLNYILGYLVIGFGIAFFMINRLGIDVNSGTISMQELMEKMQADKLFVTINSIITVTYLVGAFYLFKKFINKYATSLDSYEDETKDDNSNKPEKKDLSYFR